MLLLCPLTIGLDWWHIILKKRALLITKILYNNVKFQDNYGETISMSDSQTIESSLWQPKSRLTGLNWTKYLWAYEKIIKSFIYCLRVYVGAAWHGGSIGRSHPAAPGSNLFIQKMFSQIFEDSALMNRVVGLNSDKMEPLKWFALSVALDSFTFIRAKNCHHTACREVN